MYFTPESELVGDDPPPGAVTAFVGDNPGVLPVVDPAGAPPEPPVADPTGTGFEAPVSLSIGAATGVLGKLVPPSLSTSVT